MNSRIHFPFQCKSPNCLRVGTGKHVGEGSLLVNSGLSWVIEALMNHVWISSCKSNTVPRLLQRIVLKDLALLDN